MKKLSYLAVAAALCLTQAQGTGYLPLTVVSTVQSVATSSGGSSTPSSTAASSGSGTATSTTSSMTTVAAAGATPAAPVVPLRLRSPIGINLNSVSDHLSALPFVNVMKSSRFWFSGDANTFDNGQPLDLDANGWVRSLAPGQVARTVMLYRIGGHYPAGQYVMRWKGKGAFYLTFTGSILSRQSTRMVLQVTPDDNGIGLALTATNPANYIRNIEVIMPGGICRGDPFTYVTSVDQCGRGNFLSFVENSSIVFNPVFLNTMRYYSVLRFMGWMQTNNSPVKSWSQRTPVSYETYAVENGVPVETMIALANILGAHPWFTMPHRTENTYAQNFAQLVAQQLDPSLKVYVEYSNEVWNPGFPQYAYAVNQGAARNPPISNRQYYALRARTIGNIFKSALGPSRVVTVLAGQSGGPSVASDGLAYLKNTFGSAAIGIDAIAIAPYFAVTPNETQTPTYDAMSLDQFFNYVDAQVLPQPVSDEQGCFSLAQSYGLPMIAYEGGQHMVGIQGGENDATLNALFDAFNRDPRIKDVYLNYLNSWKQNGGELFVHLGDISFPNKWGRWGALEYVAQPRTAAPKYDALQTFIEQNPVWWAE